jgi:hypothetical protein
VALLRPCRCTTRSGSAGPSLGFASADFVGLLAGLLVGALLGAAESSAAPGPAGCGTGSWIAGTVDLCDGVLVYRDYVLDDFGAVGGGTHRWNGGVLSACGSRSEGLAGRE